MFIDVDEWSDDDLLVRVKTGQEVSRFMTTSVGKKILDRAKEKHKAAVVALTGFAVSNYSLERESDRSSLESILRDLAEPTRVMQAFADLLQDAQRSEDIYQIRRMEEQND